MKSNKQNQNGGTSWYTCIVRDCHSFVDFCNGFTNNANSQSPKVNITVLFWPLCCERVASLSKKLQRGRRAGVFIWVNFHHGHRILGFCDRGLGDRASPASHMNTSNFLTNKRVGRRGLGNWASPVDRAYTKSFVRLRKGVSVFWPRTCVTYSSSRKTHLSWEV